MRSLNLNNMYMKKYLEKMNSMGLVVCNGSEYSITTKGKEFYSLLK